MLDAQAIISESTVRKFENFCNESNVVCLFFAGSWVRGLSLDIPTWKMDAKRFEEARTRALASRKSLMPPATSKATSSSHEQTAIVVNYPSDHSTSLLRKKSTDKKRKDASSSASPSS